MNTLAGVEAHVHEHAAVQIILLFHGAEEFLVGRAVQLSSGEVGTVTDLRLDPNHGLCCTIDPIMPHGVAPQLQRFFPVSTIKVV